MYGVLRAKPKDGFLYGHTELPVVPVHSKKKGGVNFVSLK